MNICHDAHQDLMVFYVEYLYLYVLNPNQHAFFCASYQYLLSQGKTCMPGIYYTPTVLIKLISYNRAKLTLHLYHHVPF